MLKVGGFEGCTVSGRCGCHISYVGLCGWLSIKGLPSKAWLEKSGLSDGLCSICNCFKTVKHML
jgi:hypothetical protein